VNTSRSIVWATFLFVASCGKNVLELGVDGGGATGTGGGPTGAGGSTSAGGSSSAGGAGGSVIGSVNPWSGNPSDCPTTLPMGVPNDAYSAGSTPDLGNTFCEVSEGESCAYRYTKDAVPAYEACSCYEQNSAVKRWFCNAVSSPNLDLCPADQPAPGSDCSGFATLTCDYPPGLTACSCGVDDPQLKWSCHDPVTLPDSVNKSPPPDKTTAAKRIVDLTDAETHAWCAWYGTLGQQVGSPAPRPTPVTPDGYTTTGLSVNWQFFGDACRPAPLAEDQCAANMELLGCEAMLGELTDCVMTVLYGTPQPHGCGRFFEAAHCDGTIVGRAAVNALSDGGFGGGLNPDHSLNCGSVRVR
jgi:hypothetical protein